MFVRYITEKDVFENGFALNPLTNETFSRQKIDHESVSTYMQVWNDINSFSYRVVTDREGLVERGDIMTKDILAELVTEFFENDLESFLNRNIPKRFSDWGEGKKRWLHNSIMKAEPKQRGILLDKFFDMENPNER